MRRKVALLAFGFTVAAIACSLGADLDNLSSGDKGAPDGNSPDVMVEEAGPNVPPPPSSGDGGGPDSGGPQAPFCTANDAGLGICDTFESGQLSSRWGGTDLVPTSDVGSVGIVDGGSFSSPNALAIHINANQVQCSYAALLRDFADTASSIHFEAQVFANANGSGELPTYFLLVGNADPPDCSLLLGGDEGGFYLLEQSGDGDGGSNGNQTGTVRGFNAGAWTKVALDVDFVASTPAARLSVDGEGVITQNLIGPACKKAGHPHIRLGFHCQPKRPNPVTMWFDDVLFIPK